MATIHNLLPLRDGGVENHLPFLVLDFPPRGALREYHPHGRQLPLLTVISSVTSLAAALQYLHGSSGWKTAPMGLKTYTGPRASWSMDAG